MAGLYPAADRVPDADTLPDAASDPQPEPVAVAKRERVIERRPRWIAELWGEREPKPQHGSWGERRPGCVAQRQPLAERHSVAELEPIGERQRLTVPADAADPLPEPSALAIREPIALAIAQRTAGRRRLAGTVHIDPARTVRKRGAFGAVARSRIRAWRRARSSAGSPGSADGDGQRV